MTHTARYRIALLFNLHNGYGRDMIAGLAQYKEAHQLDWDLFVADDFGNRLADLAHWQGDGIIADFDDPAVVQATRQCRAPVIGVGSSYADPADYRTSLPYVASDNARIVALAHEHLIEAGLASFALYSVPPAPGKRWALERERAFEKRMRRDHAEAVIYRGCDSGLGEADGGMRELVHWLLSLPRPVGIIAVTDARARQLMQACALAGLSVARDVAIIGIDNDPLTRALTPVPLSSVIQGTEEMGRAAAALMHRALRGEHLTGARVMVAPAGINAAASTERATAHHPHVTRALHFIRHQARRGIKSEQVADFVGVCRSGLDAQFRRELGVSVHEEILRFKLAQAKQYLASGELKIADVALRCGFTSVQYMYTVFAREVGCTPRAWQERAAQEQHRALRGGAARMAMRQPAQALAA